jgi:hypothetical protein
LGKTDCKPPDLRHLTPIVHKHYSQLLRNMMHLPCAQHHVVAVQQRISLVKHKALLFQ